MVTTHRIRIISDDFMMIHGEFATDNIIHGSVQGDSLVVTLNKGVIL